MQNPSQGVNCKREILLKSVVTEDFKIDLASELRGAIENLKNQVQQITQILKQQKDKGHDLSQLENEQKKIRIGNSMVSRSLYLGEVTLTPLATPP